MLDKEFHIARKEVRKLHKAAYDAQQKGHLEVCGLLIVDDKNNIELWLLENTLNEPYKYEIHLKDIISIRRKIKTQQKKILGTFHSHPISEATPGNGDLERGFYKRIELIYDVCAKAPRLWTYRKRGAEKIAIELSLKFE